MVMDLLNILKANREGLDRLAHALIAWETMDIHQVKDVVAGIDIGVPLKSKKVEEDKNSTTTETSTDATNIKTDPVIA